MQIEWVPIGDLIPNPKNPNKHSPEQIERLAEIIKYQGWRHPIIVDKDMMIWAGHGRLLAAQKLGQQKVPIHIQEFQSPEQAYAFLVSDNAIASWADLDLGIINTDLPELGPDFNIDLLGIEGFEIEPADKGDGLCDEDEVPEKAPARTKLGDIYALGNHRLMCGDSTSVEQVTRLMNGEKADMVFTDPPYGVGVENTQGKVIGDEDLETFKACLPIMNRFAVDDAHFYVFMAAGDLLPPSIQAFSSVLPFQNILPIRCTHENKRGRKGAFKLNYEACLFGNNNLRGFNESKKFRVSKTTLDDDRYTGNGFLKVYPALWDGERATEHNMNIIHPTQKKVEMIEFYIEISSFSGSPVLDLFLGSGSTLIACEKTGRVCYGMEIDPGYCDVIVERWEKYTGKKASKLTDGQTT